MTSGRDAGWQRFAAADWAAAHDAFAAALEEAPGDPEARNAAATGEVGVAVVMSATFPRIEPRGVGGLPHLHPLDAPQGR